MNTEKQSFLFVGNHVALDFVNTQMIVKGKLTDLLETFEDLVSWLVQAKLWSKAESERVSSRFNPEQTTSLLEQGKRFRAALRVMAERITTRKPITDSAVADINHILSLRPGYPQVVRIKRGFERRFHSPAVQAESVLVPIAEAASDLLCEIDFALIKKCANAACILYFYDTTKNHRRNWCSMQLCGNRMKVAAFFQRMREGKQS